MVDTGMDALRAVDGLYRCALRDGSWEQTVREVSTFLQSSCVCIAWHDERGGRISHHCSLDDGGRDRLGVPITCEVTPERMFDRRITRQSVRFDAGDEQTQEVEENGGEVRVYAWHREPGRCPYCLGAKARIDDTTSAYIGAHWRRVEDVVGGDGGERLAALVGPFVQALRLRAHLGSLLGDLQASDAALDHLPLGVVFLDADATVVRMNKAAHTLLEMRDGIEAREGMLHLDDPGTVEELAGILRAIASGEDVPGERSLSVPRPSGLRHFEVMVLPASPEGGDGAAAIAYLSDPEEHVEVDPGTLERLFDLSPAEARVVALLARGLSPHDVAGRLQVAVGTVREHLAHVFRKTGAHRQGELLRMVLESPAVVGSPAES